MTDEAPISGRTPDLTPELLAEAFAKAGSKLGQREIMLLLAGAQALRLSQVDFAAIVHAATSVESLADLDRTGFEHVMDALVAMGFRHPWVPMLSPAQIALVDDSRWGLGISSETFAAAMRERGAAERPHLLDGRDFRIAMQWLQSQGPVLPFPRSGVVTRAIARDLFARVYWAALSPASFDHLLRELGGGVPRICHLDLRQLSRLAGWFGQRESVIPPPAPRVPAAPGFITQPQANLIWKLWHELGTSAPQGDGVPDLSEAALDDSLRFVFGLDERGRPLGFEGGLRSLTERGARAVIEAKLAIVIAMRRSDEEADRPVVN